MRSYNKGLNPAPFSASWQLNHIVPSAWIIEEDEQRKKDKKKEWREHVPLPARLPSPEDFSIPPSPALSEESEEKPESLIIIDL